MSRRPEGPGIRLPHGARCPVVVSAVRRVGTGPAGAAFSLRAAGCGSKEGGTLVSDLREMAKNRLVTLPGHFAHPVRVDSVEEIGAGFFLVKVRDSSGHLDETQVTGEELESLSPRRHR